MEKLNINTILNRNKHVEDIKEILQIFHNNNDVKTRRGGIYIYGETGVGKTMFIKELLTSLNYDIINFDAANFRNADIIENLSNDKLSNKNIYQLFKKQTQRNAIIMDEIDGMNNGDKGGINTLINIIRPKKNKKQLTENTINSPIICIGNCHIDKKIKELMKNCFVVFLNIPTDRQMMEICQKLLPNIEPHDLNFIIHKANRNLTKLNQLCSIFTNNNDLFQTLLQNKNILSANHSNDTADTVYKMIQNAYYIQQHELLIKDADRTSVGLLLHENIVDVINNVNDDNKKIKIYRKQLDNFCVADYIDRITFQKQIWEFSEMTSLLKNFHNNYLYHCEEDVKYFNGDVQLKDIRFTKVLTKYSTEYNNSQFLTLMCQKFQLDKNDLISFFAIHVDDTNLNDICTKFDINIKEVERLRKLIKEYYD